MNILAAETKKQVSLGTASPPQESRRAKENSARSKDFAEETKLADDIDSILNDAIIDQMSSGRGPITKKVRPTKRFSAAKKNYFKDDEDIVSNVGFFFNDVILQLNHRD